jgi:hypothetical protein
MGDPLVVARQLKQRWRDQALQSACIDASIWHPEKGIDQNRPCVEASYDYYARLFLRHPYLKWAGMARMIAPCFYAGFEDLSELQKDARGLATIPWALPVEREARFATRFLCHYETTFLHMQKKIFEDQAVMHEAYLTGGVQEIRKLYWARIIDRATLRAWRQIDDGVSTDESQLVDQGNRALLFREQFDIIDRFYAGLLRYQDPIGRLLTYLMTLSGAPSIPGARSFPQAFALSLLLRARLGTLEVETPLADGDIAVFAHRWKLTDEDTLPTFLEFTRRYPAEARDVVSQPIAGRMRKYRLAARAGQLAAGVMLFGLKAGRPGGGFLTRVVRPVTSVAMSGTKIVDLTDPRDRTRLEVPRGAPSQAWMNTDLQPFKVEVKLPGGRSFHSEADAVVVLCPDGERDPERVIVRLPLGDREETERRLGGYAQLDLRTEAIPAASVEGWREDIEAQREHHYSTRVFTPGKVDTVQIEFQVAHHVGENRFVITIHLTWHESFEPGEPVSVD